MERQYKRLSQICLQAGYCIKRAVEILRAILAHLSEEPLFVTTKCYRRQSSTFSVISEEVETPETKHWDTFSTLANKPHLLSEDANATMFLLGYALILWPFASSPNKSRLYKSKKRRH